jgi:membrane associated rhomboid family serine protease
MLLPYSVDVPMERWPFVNWALIAVTIFISMGIFIEDAHNSRLTPQQIERRIEDLEKQGLDDDAIDRILEGQFDRTSSWALKPHNFSFLQLFSCLFVHLDLFHLVGNMFFLFVFGNAVNAKLGHVPFLLSYLLLGAMASLAWLVLGNGQPAVGASGAIMGIVGLFLVLFPRNDVTILYWFSFAYAGTFDLSALWVILAYLGADFWGTLRDGEGGVAYVAHLGGAVAGIGLGMTALALGYLAPLRGEENLLQFMGWQEKRPKKKKKKRPATVTE